MVIGRRRTGPVLTRRIAALLAPVLLLGAWGCEEEGIRVYEAPKDPPRPQFAGAEPAASDRAGGFRAPAMTWTPPPAWHEAERDVAMRLATFHSRDHGHDEPGIEIAVSSFPGDVGGNLANVNRWREQLGLAPLDSDEQLRDKLEPFGDEQAVHGWTLRIDTAGGAGMLAAIIRAAGVEHTWFVRASGDAASLDAHEQELRDFAMSFRLAAPATTDPADAPTDDASAPVYD